MLHVLRPKLSSCAARPSDGREDAWMMQCLRTPSREHPLVAASLPEPRLLTTLSVEGIRAAMRGGDGLAHAVAVHPCKHPRLARWAVDRMLNRTRVRRNPNRTRAVRMHAHGR